MMINKRLRILKDGVYVRFRTDERKTKLPFMIYVDFESILIPENNE